MIESYNIYQSQINPTCTADFEFVHVFLPLKKFFFTFQNAAAIIVKHFDHSHTQSIMVQKEQPPEEPVQVKKEPGLFDLPSSSASIKQEKIDGAAETMIEELVTQPKC